MIPFQFLDRNALLELKTFLGHDLETLKQLFLDFLISAEEFDQSVLESTVLEQHMTFAVHSFKSSCGAIGALTLFRLCDRLEADLRKNSDQKIYLPLMPEIKSALKGTIHEVYLMLNGSPSKISDETTI